MITVVLPSVAGNNCDLHKMVVVALVYIKIYMYEYKNQDPLISDCLITPTPTHIFQSEKENGDENNEFKTALSFRIFAENTELYNKYTVSKWVCLQLFLTEEMVHSTRMEFARLVNFQTTYTRKCAT